MTVEVFNLSHPITNGISTFGITTNNMEYHGSIDANAVALGGVLTLEDRNTIVYQDGVGRSVYLGGIYSASSDPNTIRQGVEDQLLEQAVHWAGTAIPLPAAVWMALPVLGGLGLIQRRRRSIV